MIRLLPVLAAGLALCGAALAQDAAAPDPQSNPEMAEIIAGDQGDRSMDPAQIDWAALNARDAARRARTRELLEAGALTTADDFFYAAYVFQHGTEADDHLLAHALAMAAQAKGRADAAEIAAATLDRFLQSIGRPQVFGTQYSQRLTPDGEGAISQEPFDRALIPDSVRTALGGPTLQQLDEQLQTLQTR